MTVNDTDKQLIKELHAFKKVDRIIGEVALKVFGTHAWYLTSEWAMSVLFSRLIGIEEKKELVNKLLSMPNQPVLRDRDKKSVYGKPQFPSINGMQNAILSILIHVFSSEY